MSLKEVYQLSLAAGFLQVKLREDHELILLAERIDWESLTRKLRSKYSKVGRRAKHMRMMIGLHFLKHLYNLSDETVCNMLHENVYHRFFCGLYGDIEDWERKRPLNPSTMSHFRKRLGADGMKVIEDVIKEQLKKERRVSKRTQVVDTTAMEKHIAYPTDTNLLVKGMQRVRRIVDKLKKLGVEMSVRSYKRLARQQVLLINKLGRGRKDRLEQATKNLMKYAKSMCNKVSSGIAAASEQGLEAVAMFKEAVEKEIEKLHKVIDQAKRRLAGEQVPAKDKIFSMHESDVTVIAKGKRGKRYEFGSKVSFSMDSNGYVMGHQEYHSNIADNNTMDKAIDDWVKTFGDHPDEFGADRGYTASNPSETLSKVKKIAIPRRGKRRHPDHDKAYFRRVLRIRNCIEPTIGHLKTDHRLNRSRYTGAVGDTLNVGFATTAWNLRKWSKELRQEARKKAA